MKREGLFTGFVLLVIFFLTSANAKQEGEDYFPMSDGARWEYSVKTINMNKASDPGMKGTMVMHIDGEKTINGKRYYKVAVSSTVPVIGQPLYYYRKAKDGIYVGWEEKGKPEQLEIPFPPTVGKTWSRESTMYDKTTHEELRIMGNETLFVLDKKYEDCIKVSSKATFKEKSDTTVLDSVIYYVPDIGMVKTNLIFPGETTVEFTLTAYKP